MANPGQPTIRRGDVGEPVRRLQRACRRLAPLEAPADDGVFGPQTEAFVRNFQEGEHLVVDGIVGPATWAALPDGGLMPVLRIGSHGPAVASLQTVLQRLSADPIWGVGSPGASDGQFGAHTQGSVIDLQHHNHLVADGVVGEMTWGVPLDFGEPLEMAVGLEFVTS